MSRSQFASMLTTFLGDVDGATLTDSNREELLGLVQDALQETLRNYIARLSQQRRYGTCDSHTVAAMNSTTTSSSNNAKYGNFRSTQLAPPPRKQTDLSQIVAAALFALGPPRETFLNIAVSHRGWISIPEFRAVCSKRGIELDDAQVQTLFDKNVKAGEEPGPKMTYAHFLRFLDNRHRPASEAQLAIPAKMPVEYSSTPALNLDDEAEAELWFNEGVKTLSSQVYIKAFSLRELFLQLDTNRTGAVTVEQLVDSMLQNGFPEPGNPETRPRLLNVVHRTMRILYDLRSRRTDGPSVAGMTAQQRLARAARAYNGDVSYLDMVDIFLGRISPLKLKKMQEERKDKYGDDDTESERRYMRVQQVLRHALRAARADRATFDNLYRSMDKDRDGWISIDEICQGLEALSIGANFSKQNEFRLFVAQYCHVQPGYLNPEEYDAFMNLRHPSTCTPERLELDALMNAGARANAVRAAPIPMPANARPEQLLEVLVEHLSEEFIELQTAFKQFDADCDGRISEAEFFHAINDLGIAASPSVAKTLFESFDLNGVGVVTLNEFVRALGTLRQQMQFRKANRRPSVAVESGMSQINAQLSSKAGVMTNTNVNVATGLARPQTATAVLTGGSSAKKLDFSDVFNLSRSEFELTDAAVKSIVKALRVNPNSATRDIFRRVDRGNKNKVSTQDIVFAFEAANPSLPVPMEAIKAVMTRLCPSGDDALGLSAFTRLLSAKGVSDL